jgi:type IX secretion system PorP/SprF family membrane protein
MKELIKVIVVGLVMTTGLVLAQQDPMYNQYIFNAYTINPAEAGTRTFGTASILQRWQWLGVDGAPSTTSFGLEASYRKSWGFGLNTISDRLGPERNQTINFSTGYHIRLTEKYFFASGLSFVANQRRVDISELDVIDDPDDPDLQNINTFRPNVGGGLLIYSDAFFFGVALPRWIEYRLTSDAANIALDQVRHLFIYSGKIFNLSERVAFKPSTLLKLVSGAPSQFDFNAVVSVRKAFDFGVNYRVGDAVGLLAGVKLSDRFVLNYSYEMPVSVIRRTSSFNHELGLRYRFGRPSVDNVQSPRFFN